MKRNELLKKIKSQLENQNVDDIKTVICEVLGIKTKDYVLKTDFSDEEVQEINKVVAKLKKNMPLDKILGRKCFFGRDFVTNCDVLSPRKETEILVEQCLKFLKNGKGEVLDLCCGSGCIGLSVACENDCARVVMSDISPQALDVAKQNATKLGAKNVEFVQGDMFEGLKHGKKFDIIISNPPYIQTNIIATLSPQVRCFDPILALDGGDDGLRFYRQIASRGGQFLKTGGVVCVEIGFDQGGVVQQLFKNAGYETQLIKDYDQNDRVVVAKKREEND